MLYYIILIIIVIFILNKNNIIENFETNDFLVIVNNINKKKFYTTKLEFKNNISLIIYNFTKFFENNILIKNNLYDYKFIKTDNLVVNFKEKSIKFNFYINTYKLNGYIFETYIIKNNNDYIINYIKKNNYINLEEYILNNPYNNYDRIGKVNDIGKKVSINKKKIEGLLKKKKYRTKYRCINSKGYNKYECEKNYDRYGHLKEVGIWDKPCEKNEDCPFYKANKNYENNNGKCFNSYCELPLGMKLLGYTKFDNNYKPICRGCNNNNIFCCEEQENKILYPNLKSPDYLF
jgi:hypothetical protein